VLQDQLVVKAPQVLPVVRADWVKQAILAVKETQVLLAQLVVAVALLDYFLI
jgi:hypothetical protein